MTIVNIGEVRTATGRMTIRGRPGDDTDAIEISTIPGLWTARKPADVRAAARLMDAAVDWLDTREAARKAADQLALNLGDHL